MSSRAALALVAVVVVAVAAAPASAATTTCRFSGPAGTYRAIPLRVEQPGTALNVSIDATSSRTGLTHASWHLAAGIVVVDLATVTPVAYAIANDGVSPRRVVIGAGDRQPTAADVPGPGIPLRHDEVVPAPGLAPGEYAVVAFGSDGAGADPASAPPVWNASLLVDGTHSCASRGSGTVFDEDITAFQGGTIVAAGSAVVADGATLARTLDRALVVGLIDAHGGPGGSAALAYRHPSSSGEIAQDITAFASRGGAFSWTATATGLLASVDIAGVALDLPASARSRASTRATRTRRNQKGRR